MTQTLLEANPKDARRYLRVPFAGTVNYRYADEQGAATCNDLGRGGLRLQLGRYLRPGRRIMLTLTDVMSGSHPVELKAEVVWCRPASGSCTFTTGLRVYHDDLDTTHTLSVLIDRELEMLGFFEALRAQAADPTRIAAPEHPQRAWNLGLAEPALAVSLLLAITPIV